MHTKTHRHFNCWWKQEGSQCEKAASERRPRWLVLICSSWTSHLRMASPQWSSATTPVPLGLLLEHIQASPQCASQLLWPKDQQKGPVLDSAFYNPMRAWSGGLDHQSEMHDLNTAQESCGNSWCPIRRGECCPEVNMIVTGSWESDS